MFVGFSRPYHGIVEDGSDLTDAPDLGDAPTLYQAAVESSPDGVLVVDDDGVIRLANQALAVMFGVAMDALVGDRVESLIPESVRQAHVRSRRSFAHDPEARPMGTGLQLFGLHSDGHTFPVEIGLSPIGADRGALTVATVRDVTDRQATRSSLALAEERERIARDLHDMIIQRVFASGMALQATMSFVESPTVRERISEVIDDLDVTIGELRNAIFRLGSIDVERSLTTQLRSLVDERSRTLGFDPTLTVEGEIDDVPDHVAEQLLATVTEALSNVARHAAATEVRIDVVGHDRHLELTVSDDGTGITGTPKPRGGLSNMMWRAAELGGSCAVEPNEPRGTVLTWRVPS